jgi:hypothetical protein
MINLVAKVHLFQIILLIQKIDAKMMPVLGAKLKWCVVSMGTE